MEIITKGTRFVPVLPDGEVIDIDRMAVNPNCFTAYRNKKLTELGQSCTDTKGRRYLYVEYTIASGDVTTVGISTFTKFAVSTEDTATPYKASFLSGSNGAGIYCGMTFAKTGSGASVGDKYYFMILLTVPLSTITLT
jgi:hypothetical protein